MSQRHTHFIALWVVVILTAIGLPACDDESPKKSESEAVVPQPLGGNACASNYATPAPTVAPVGLPGYGLQSAATTYEADIKPIVTAKCFTCHNGTNTAAVNWADSTGQIDYQKIADNKTLIDSVVTGALSSHDPVTLDATEIQKFAAWKTAGYPRGDVVTPTPTPTPFPASTTGSQVPTNPCSPVGVGGNGVDQSSMDALINSQLHLQCKNAGKLTDRKYKKCLDDVPLDMSWCNDTGIRNKFDELVLAGADMAAEIERLKKLGYTIEGCGVHQQTNVPYVSWIFPNHAEGKLENWMNIGEAPGAN